MELKYLPSGTAVADISLAVNSKRKQNEEWVDQVDFFDVTLFARTAEIASEYLSKGSPALIEGRLKQETWEKDGQKRSKVKVVGERLQLLGSRADSQQSGSQETNTNARQLQDSTDNDGIPF